VIRESSTTVLADHATCERTERCSNSRWEAEVDGTVATVDDVERIQHPVASGSAAQIGARSH
jgi:hypothetical protein